MSRYFAELDSDNVVLRVIVCDDPQWLTERLGGTWVETADPYAPQPGEVAYCGPGWGHDDAWPVRFAPQWVQPLGADVEEAAPYGVGAVVFHDGHLWVSTYDPNVSVPGQANWRRTPVIPGQPPQWTQPSGSTDAWKMGEHVLHNGQEWVVTQTDGAGNNIWEPGVFGWTVVP